jgi:hypothetical protein
VLDAVATLRQLDGKGPFGAVVRFERLAGGGAEIAQFGVRNGTKMAFSD